jgi:hypothetical protein
LGQAHTYTCGNLIVNGSFKNVADLSGMPERVKLDFTQLDSVTRNQKAA